MREKMEIITEEVLEFQVMHVSNYQGKLMKRNTLEKKFNSKIKENLCIQEKHNRTKVRLTSDFQTAALNANDQRF